MAGPSYHFGLTAHLPRGSNTCLRAEPVQDVGDVVVVDRGHGLARAIAKSCPLPGKPDIEADIAE
jgi:hypothetical protein